MDEADDAIRDALSKHLASKRADPEFTERLRARIEQDRPILDRLADDDHLVILDEDRDGLPGPLAHVTAEPGEPIKMIGMGGQDMSTVDRVQCSPPQPGDEVWIGDQRYRLMPDGSFSPWPPPVVTVGGTVLDWIIERVFCPACLRTRFNPGHWLSCR